MFVIRFHICLMNTRKYVLYHEFRQYIIEEEIRIACETSLQSDRRDLYVHLERENASKRFDGWLFVSLK